MQEDIETSEVELASVKTILNSMVTEQQTKTARIKKEIEFKELFSSYTSQLTLKTLAGPQYLDLYRINSFPRQGVELHKTVMAYHFALNAMIAKSKKAHRLPFLLDAILKEDLDETNLETILSFVGNNLPDDTQSFISIAEHVRDDSGNEDENNVKPIEKLRVNDVKDTYFPKNSKLLYIGSGKIERGFLSQLLANFQELHMDTIEITAI
jgi:hypothetical protein